MKRNVFQPKWISLFLIVFGAILALGVVGCDLLEEDNYSPVITLTVPATVAPGESVTFQATALDPDGDTLTYSWTVDGTPLSDTTPIVTWTVPDAKKTVTVEVSVSDGKNSPVVLRQGINIQTGDGQPPQVHKNRSVRADTPPKIDGKVSLGEWDKAAKQSPLIDLRHGKMLVQNDHQYLYLLVDLTGDTHDDPISFDEGDHFSLTFDVDSDKTITPNEDISYGYVLAAGTGKPVFVLSYWLRPNVLTTVKKTTSSLGIGFGPSLFSARDHRIWEFAISFDELKEDTEEWSSWWTGPKRIGLRTKSAEPPFDDSHPENFTSDFHNLIEIYAPN